MAGNYKTLRTTGVRGINQNEYVHLPDELLSATNVWAPNGIIESRPGYWPINLLGITAAQTAVGSAYVELYHADHSASPPIITRVDAGSGGVMPQTNSGDNWYIGCSTTDIASLILYGFSVTGGASVGGNLRATFYYSDGTAWRPMFAYLMKKIKGNTPYYSKIDWIDIGESGGDDGFLAFKPPADMSSVLPTGWSPATISNGAGTVRKPIRIHFQNESGTGAGANIPTFTWDTNGGVTNPFFGYTYYVDSTYDTTGTVINRTVGIFKLKGGTSSGIGFLSLLSLPSISGFCVVTFNPQIDACRHIRGPSFVGTGGVPFDASTLPEFPPSVAIVPDVGEYYLAYNNSIVSQSIQQVYEGVVTSTRADVESRPELVGPGAPFSTAYVAQRSDFPPANCITYWNSRLWAADRSSVFWSAPFPFHKVWPLLSVEPLPVEHESVRAVFGYQQSVLCFTESNIFRVSPAGEDDFGTLTVSIDKTVSGVGTTAPNSIVNINGMVVFLGENSIYAYNGTPIVKDVTEVTVATSNGEETVRRLSKLLATVTLGSRSNAVGVHWRSAHCYLLALAVDGSLTNNRVLVWDYVNNSWWVWNLAVTAWYIENEDGQNESLYFGSTDSFIYKFTGFQDYTSNFPVEVMTHKLGFESQMRKTFRRVTVEGAPSMRETTLEGFPNGETQTAVFSGELDFKDGLEYSWPVSNGVAKWTRNVVRMKKLGVRTTAQGLNVKVSSAAGDDNLPFRLGDIEVDFIPLGSRR